MQQDWLSTDDVISIKEMPDGQVHGFLGGVAITEQEKRNLQQEARTVEQFRIWAIFQGTARQKAIERVMMGTPIEDDKQELLRLLSGKMMLYVLDIQKSILENIMKLS